MTSVEQAVRNRMENEVPSTVIGGVVMEQLKAVDEVAPMSVLPLFTGSLKILTFSWRELENLLARGQN